MTSGLRSWVSAPITWLDAGPPASAAAISSLRASSSPRLTSVWATVPTRLRSPLASKLPSALTAAGPPSSPIAATAA